MKKAISVILTVAMIATLSVCLLACSKDAPSKQEGFVGNSTDGKYWVNTSHEIVDKIDGFMMGDGENPMYGKKLKGTTVELHRNRRKKYIVYGIKCNITVDADVEWVIKCLQAASSTDPLSIEQRVQFQKGVSKTIEFSFTEPVDKKFNLYLNKIGIIFEDDTPHIMGVVGDDDTQRIYKTITDIQLLIAKAE